MRAVIAESHQLFALFWPILIAQIAEHAMGFVDTLMASQAGPTDLAAIAMGSGIWLPLMLTLCGILMATTPLVAHQVGSDQEAESAAVLRQALTLALLLSIAAILLLNNTAPLLSLFQLEHELAAKTSDYLSAISLGTPALLLYQALRRFSEGFGRTRPIMRIAVIGMLCNIPLNYVLIFGKLGLPALGGVGCGYATSLVMWLMLALGIYHLRREPLFRQARAAMRWRFPTLRSLIQFLALGLPIGLALLIESSMFSLIVLFLAKYGEETISAHQITFSVTGLMFMFPLSLSMALTIRTGQLLGRKHYAAARFSVMCGFALTILIALINATLLLSTSRQIASAYTEVSTIIDTAMKLMWIAALFQITDSIQVASSGALRGYKDTAATLIVVFIAYWLAGLPFGYWLAERLGLGVYGYWWGLVAGLSLGALLLATRLYRISHASTHVLHFPTTPDSDRVQ
ncbi:multidrug resistance protein PmpM [Marinobacterium zhoushanense]|uniref:Multidrug-efflux transporter n=1 Tax=Marinobacterium zhoushanense TaxID=1679163 RepID=A0ABQ1KB34_9GAMM|nr:MATE family efflux transporter [Marinobacterium zhoushanense]GGB90116.1 multidrug resistance protein PmpM [Marinobacterium zhoushanense]